ncbi:MAG: hypothetical protein ACRDO8_05415 [Nocardioidaceae bacterium]
MTASLALARAVADAVLYEGYLLYPYRASSRKNQARWQFGVLGPPGAADDGLGEEAGMFADSLLDAPQGSTVELRLRFLQLQARIVERVDGPGFVPVDELTVADTHWITWDEATEHEVELGTFDVADLAAGRTVPVEIAGGEEQEPILDADGRVAGRLVRRRRPLRAGVRISSTPVDGYARLRVRVDNTAYERAASKDDAIAHSFIGAHLLLVADSADFVSLLEPPEQAEAAVTACDQHRAWPVLAGPEGQTDVLLLSPIILYDHPSVAPESAGELFDSTEIDEILTLRVMTMTEEEKAEARATDPRAAAIIDRCDAMSAQELQNLHGVLRDPHALEDAPLETGVPELHTPGMGSAPGDTDVPWWDPEADASVAPDSDAVMIDGVPVAKGSMVTVRPSRRADAQDLFFAGRTGRVASVHFDVDGSTHVAVVLVDDPAADLHDWYGRYLYFAPDEIEPHAPAHPDDRKERQP